MDSPNPETLSNSKLTPLPSVRISRQQSKNRPRLFVVAGFAIGSAQASPGLAERPPIPPALHRLHGIGTYSVPNYRRLRKCCYVLGELCWLTGVFYSDGAPPLFSGARARRHPFSHRRRARRQPRPIIFDAPKTIIFRDHVGFEAVSSSPTHANPAGRSPQKSVKDHPPDRAARSARFPVAGCRLPSISD